MSNCLHIDHFLPFEHKSGEHDGVAADVQQSAFAHGKVTAVVRLKGWGKGQYGGEESKNPTRVEQKSTSTARGSPNSPFRTIWRIFCHAGKNLLQNP